MGGSAKELTKASPQSAQISGEVRTKTRGGNSPAMRSMRGASDRSKPVPATTLYLAVGVSTRMVCTLDPFYGICTVYLFSPLEFERS